MLLHIVSTPLRDLKCYQIVNREFEKIELPARARGVRLVLQIDIDMMWCQRAFYQRRRRGAMLLLERGSLSKRVAPIAGEVASRRGRFLQATRQ